jgi:hypothetical protein
MFYNVENWFDSYVDTTRQYNEFSPEGNRHWTYSRYTDKKHNVYKVITAVGSGELPAIVAFAEVENRWVLEDLVGTTPLKNFNYNVVHYESGDDRGIDVGLIYLEDDFTVCFSTPVSIPASGGTTLQTRDILYVKGTLLSDTLHLLINHWPSRYGGLLETDPLRVAAAETLKSITDSISKAQANSAILVMGDFNDNPGDQSLRLLTDSDKHPLYPIPSSATNTQVEGSLKYQGKWEQFDQFLVSEGLRENLSSAWVCSNEAVVFDADFLLEKDEKHLGLKPFRTYSGFRYHGGFSDHLPIFVDLYAIDPK